MLVEYCAICSIRTNNSLFLLMVAFLHPVLCEHIYTYIHLYTHEKIKTNLCRKAGHAVRIQFHTSLISGSFKHGQRASI